MKTYLRLSLILFLLLSSTACRQPLLSKYETRAVWMSRFEYAQDKTSEESQTYIREAFRRFHEAGMNVIIFQVRGNGDAFYQSQYEPWSDMLSGQIGQDPGWDALQFAIDEARQYGLELHAWINTFPAWRAQDSLPPASEPLHPILAHPEWLVCDSLGNPMKPTAGYLTLSPGIPEVQEHVQNVVLDIVANYDVDGIHFDYIRYPESSVARGYSHDSVSVKRFRSIEENPLQLDWDDWQREQIHHFVSSVYNRITALKPWIKVSAAVIGHHHGVAWDGYQAVYQDARRWLATGKMDMLFPMTYTPIGHPTAPYELAIQQWQSMTHLDRPIFPGIATYKLGRQYTPREVYRQIELLRRQGFPGMVFFSAQSLLGVLDQLEKKYYPKAALPVPMSWKKDVPLLQPLQAQMEEQSGAVMLSWQIQPEVNKYVIYTSADIDDPDHILVILPGNQHSLRLSEKGSGDDYHITAINRAGMEGPAVVFKRQKIALKK